MNNISKLNSNPTFGSLIYVSPKAFKKATNNLLAKNGVCLHMPRNIYDTKYLKTGWTDNASYSTIGVIKNTDGDAFMFQANPNDNVCNILERLDNAVDNLKRPNQKLTGLLIGGNPHYELSTLLNESLQKIFKALNINYSALLGQKLPGKKFPFVPSCDLYYNGAKNKYIVNFVNDVDAKIHNTKDLAKHFDIVKIAATDKLKFD